MSEFTQALFNFKSAMNSSTVTGTGCGSDSSTSTTSPTFSKSDFMSMACALVDASSQIKSSEPKLLEYNEETAKQDVFADIQTSPLSSSWGSMSLTDILDPTNTVSSSNTQEIDCMTFFSSSSPVSEPTAVCEYSELFTELENFEPQEMRSPSPPVKKMPRNDERRESESELPSSKTSVSEPEPVVVQIRVPSRSNQPMDIKFNQPVKIIVCQEETYIDPDTNETLKGLFEFELTSDSIQLTPTS